MPRHQDRAKEQAKVATGVLESLDGPVVVLPGVVSDEREVAKVDWTSIDPSQLIPYQTELAAEDQSGAYRRQRMDQIIVGVIRYGEPSLLTIAATLAVKLGDQIGYAIPTVDEWYQINLDTFRDRCRYAHGVFKGRLMAAVVDRADKPYVPREHFRDNLPLLAANNAFNPEHFKRTGTINIDASNNVDIQRAIVMVGENITAEQRAIAEANT